MKGSTLGKAFSITTFGESHGAGIGVVIDGCPAGLVIDSEFIQNQLDRRRPGQSKVTTQRKEQDEFEILSGVFEGKSTGTPLTMFIRNMDARSHDYSAIKHVHRPGHADFTYHEKYGARDYRGGGRASARETASRVMAGSVAQLLLKEYGIQIMSFVDQVGSVMLKKNQDDFSLVDIESSIVRCPDSTVSDQMISLIENVRQDGDSLGGAIKCIIKGLPVGLGEPVFDKLHADLGKAMLSINACKGFEIGEGFGACSMRGSEHNDEFVTKNDKVITTTNHSGGVLGGISNGMDVVFRCAFKPVSTIQKAQKTVDVNGDEIDIQVNGRHDPCVVPRAVPIVDAMAAIVIADHLLRDRLTKL